MKRALVIFNPSAGVLVKQDIERLTRERLSQAGYVAEVFYLDRDFETKLARYQGQDIALVVAVGGDGTAKVAARTIVQRGWHCRLLIAPFGSANVLATSLGLPLSVKSALALIDGKKTRRIDLGVVNGRYYFTVGFSLGYISQVVTAASRELKNRFGNWGYLWIFFFSKIRLARIKFRVRSGDKNYWVKGNSLVVFNVLSYLGLRPKKNISSEDGIFNLYIFTSRGFFTLVDGFWQLLWHHQPPRHVFSLDGNHFEISIRRRRHLMTSQVDGDYIDLGNDKNIVIDVLPQAVEVIVK